jgi:hypothetical protein
VKNSLAKPQFSFALAINLVAWPLSRAWSDRNAMAMGHEVEVRKP